MLGVVSRAVKGRIALLGLVILLFDIVAKIAVQTFIPLSRHSSHYPYGGIAVFRDFFGIEFSIGHTTNTGAAWGVLGDYPYLLLAFRIVLIAVLIGVYLYRVQSWVMAIPMMCIIAGALGNVIDFLAYGHVVDMFHFKFWGYDYPVFNVADSSIFIGVCWLLLLSWLRSEGSEQHGR